MCRKLGRPGSGEAERGGKGPDEAHDVKLKSLDSKSWKRRQENPNGSFLPSCEL